MSGPVLSFIVPHRNHGEYLNRCIQSCLTASSLEAEVILIDDASDDGSVCEVAAWEGRDDRVSVLRNERNLGVEATLNRGLELARGEFVVFRAADDCSLAFFLDEGVALLRRWPEAAYCLGDIRFFVDDFESGRVESMGREGGARFVRPDCWNEDFGGEGLTVAASLIRRQHAQRIGGMDATLRWLSDWAMMVELGLSHGMVYLPRPSCAMKIHAASYNSVGSANRTENGRALVRMLSRFSGKGEVFVERLAASRLLGFFRTGLSAVDGATLSAEGSGARRLLESAFGEVPGERFACGMPLVLEKFLRESEEAIRVSRRVGVFGGGGHTRILLGVWRKLGMPLPDMILSSESLEERVFEGVATGKASESAGGGFDLIVLSSKSYESELASLAESYFPDAQILRIWG